MSKRSAIGWAFIEVLGVRTLKTMHNHQEVADYLERLDAPKLRKLLLEAAFQHTALWKRLSTQATAARRPGLDALEQALRHSLTPEGDLGWVDDAGYADRVIERFHESSYLIEKDYWLMHGLWALQKQGWQFQLKGGSSLSKGFGIIQRFSEHIDGL